MLYEGVNFNAAEVRKMDMDDFIARHLPLFWRDRDEQTRRKMLAEVYRFIRPAKRKKQNKE